MYTSDDADSVGTEESRYFTSIGWAIKKDMWDIVRSNWLLDKRGWDFSMNTFLENHRALRILQPRLARATHMREQRILAEKEDNIVHESITIKPSAISRLAPEIMGTIASRPANRIKKPAVLYRHVAFLFRSSLLRATT